MLKCIYTIVLTIFFSALYAQTITDNKEKAIVTEADTATVKTLHKQAFESQDSVSAFKYQQAAKEIAINLSNKKWLIENTIIEATIYHFYNNERKAIEINYKAAELAILHKKENSLMPIWQNQGTYYSNIGNSKKAVEYFYKALKIATDKSNPISTANCLEYIASDTYDKLNNNEEDFKRAIQFYKQAIVIYEKNKLWANLSSCYSNLGLTQQTHNDNKDAFVSYKNALNIATIHGQSFKESQHLTLGAFAISNIGFLFLEKMKQYDSAIYYCNKALPILKKYDEQYTIARNYLNIGEAYYHQNKLLVAKLYLDSALQIAIDIEDIEGQMLVWQTMHKVDSATNNLSKALMAFKNYTALKDSLSTLEKTKVIAKLNIQFDTEKKDLQIINQQQQLRNNKWIIGLVILLALLAAGISYFIYRSKKLAANNFIQKEKLLVAQKENAETSLALAEEKINNAELELLAEQDEKEQILLREKLQTAENLRLQNDIGTKQKEIVTNILNIQQKNTLLEELRKELATMAQKGTEDTQDTIKSMRRSIKNNIGFDEGWDKVKLHFEDVHNDFFEKLKTIAPDLTQNELKQCAYIKINMGTKEVASLLGIDAQSVRMSRYRMKKKLKLAEAEDLNSFIFKL
jgi:tetratricopeptide (TPR) repeat protein